MADQQFYTIITTIGKSKIANATAFGTKINFATLKVGDGNGNYYEPTESQTDLVHTVWSGTITNVTTDTDNPNWLVIGVVLPSDVGGFTIREVGIFDGAGNMIAIGKYPETYKPVAENGSTKDLTIKTILEVSNSSSVELKVDPNIIIATKADFNALAGAGRTTETVKKNAKDIAALSTQMGEKANQIDLATTNNNIATNTADIALKANQSDLVATNSNVALKADKSYLDTKFGSIGNTKVFKGSCLYANLPTSGIAVDDYWYITDKSTNYCWNGTSWADIGNNLNVGDKAITPIKTNFLKLGNLFNPATITNNSYISPTDGTIQASEISWSSDFIEVSPGATLYFYGVRTLCSFFAYKADHTYLKKMVLIPVNETVSCFTMSNPTDALYIRITAQHTNLEPIECYFGEDITLDKKQGYRFDDLMPIPIKLNEAVLSEALSNFNIYHADIDWELNSATNLFNSATVTPNYVNVTDGNLVTSDVSYASDYIAVLPNKLYSASLPGNLCIAFYDSSKVFISGLTNIAAFSTPSNTAYLRVSQRTANIASANFVVCEGEMKIKYTLLASKLAMLEQLDGVGIINVNRFLRLPSETDDSPRIQRAISCAKNKTVYIPAGDYQIGKTLNITNRASLKMDKGTNLIAIASMDYVVVYDGGYQYNNLIVSNEDNTVFDDLNIFVEGGNIDGKGLASCLNIKSYKHFALRDISLHNGKLYGLRIGGDYAHGYELIANNVYCKCTMTGLVGNIGVSSLESDSHYADIIVVDYTIGIEMIGGANRLTRCHVWGGIVADISNSVAFSLVGADNMLRDCYADTAKIGFDVQNDTRLLGCVGFNNYGKFGLDNVIYIRNTNGNRLLVTDGRYTLCSPVTTFYSGIVNSTVTFRDNYLNGLTLPV